MKRIYIISAMLLGGMFIFGGCAKDSLNQSLGIPEGAFVLSSEGFHFGTKTSVQAEHVYWADGDKVKLRGNDYTVTVNSNHDAYTEGVTGSGTIYGYYPHDLVVSDYNSDNTTVTIPSSYVSHFEGSRQIIKLPMIGKAAENATSIEFKHLTSAIKVRIKNITGQDLYIDKVVVSSTTQKLCGSTEVDLGNINDISPDAAASDAEKSVAVNFNFNSDAVSNYTSDADIKEVQVPILPIEEGNLTIEVYTHKMVDHSSDNSGLLTVSYSYNYSETNSAPDMARNIMVTANVLIQTEAQATIAGVTTITEVDHSLFSIARTGSYGNYTYSKVRFSKGNLQYQASDGGTWRFAEKQYTYIGDAAGNNTAEGSRATQDSWIDLFGWATSGYNDKFPYMNSKYNGDYGNGSTDITGSDYDWGKYNAISNGGDVVNQWRTMTSSEWSFMVTGGESSIRYTSNAVQTTNMPVGATGNNEKVMFFVAQVNNIFGLVVIPDKYDHPLDATINGTINYNCIIASQRADITLSVWNKMEASGAVFLPAAGTRFNTSVSNVGNKGLYWSISRRSSSDTQSANALIFTNVDGSFTPTYASRCNGGSVRLVKDE